MLKPLDPQAVLSLLEQVTAPDGAEVEGIVFLHRIDATKLEASRGIVEGWIAELPDQFLGDKGGGWSFLNLCQDRSGRLWTGEHRVMEALLVLAMALGRARYVLPRSVWSALPGAMPYVVFNRVQEIADA